MINKPYAGLTISIISVSFAAILIVTSKAEPLSIAFFRLLFTTLLILPWVTFHKKTRDELKTISRSNLLIMSGIGLILAAHFALWITSLSYTSVASSVILVTAHPVLVAPISYYFLKEKLTKINAAGIAISLTGVFILVYGNYGFSLSLDTLEGNILATLGGAAAGLYILGGRKLRKTVSIATYAFIVYAISTIALFFICITFNAPIYGLPVREYLIILLMAVIAGIFGHTLYNWSLKYIRASIASVSLLGEPIGSSILAFILPWINQIPSQYTFIGGTIILFGIYLTSRPQK